MSEPAKYVKTPLMKQYYDIKVVHPDAILLFRVGDFYETFGEDAIKASSILGITLTRRANGAASFVELAGFPYHSIDTYLPKLVRAGERVAICEQLEDPKTTKTIVKRGVIELVTPGVAMSDNVLQPKSNTFLAAVYFGKHSTGAAFLDISTGEFYAAEGTDAYVDKLLSSLSPKEIIYPRGRDDHFKHLFGASHYTYRLDEWVFSQEINREKLCKQFGAASLKGFGIDQMGEAIAAAGAILYYLEFTEHRQTGHISSISRLDEGSHVWIDRFTMRNLELFESNSQRSRGGFFQAIDRTSTPMGGRMLRRWIAMPLKDAEQIGARLDAVEAFIKDETVREEALRCISQMGDVERIASRIATGRVTPREVAHLRGALNSIGTLKTILGASGSQPLQSLASQLDPCSTIGTRIGRDIYPDPSNQIAKGGVIADGVDAALDELRRTESYGKDIINDIQQRESATTGIPSLKVSFNNVFGYYIEVRNAHRDKVPESWIRKQTLTGAERYITAELKDYEQKILGAQERILAIEQRLWSELLAFLVEGLPALQRNAAAVGRIDCLLSFAQAAVERNYCRPVPDQSKALEIEQGRHPVIETLLPVGEQYVPNDVYLDDERQQIIMVTGPNMSGKSALLRQTALIVLMAQMGSFVPAARARIGIIDKIFTRVGASDNISEGESTFMVEMTESASILNNISDRSLILLDEIGRGTSTYDGISIAWAMVEYIHNHPSGAKAKTLFATHYHELNEMEKICSRVKNFNVAVREDGRNIVFLRKLVPGGTAHSFGIHVAQMAGMPARIVERAAQILSSLEASREEGTLGQQQVTLEKKPTKTEKKTTQGNIQLSMFQLNDPVLREIRDSIKKIDINSLTPIEALNKLNEIKKITGL